MLLLLYYALIDLKSMLCNRVQKSEIRVSIL